MPPLRNNTTQLPTTKKFENNENSGAEMVNDYLKFIGKL